MTLIEIAGEAMRPIESIAGDLSIGKDEFEFYGRHMAKLKLALLDRLNTERNPGKLVLVTAMTPTRSGEGKTTTSIGISDAINRSGSSMVVLREPSLGPMFGVKGGGTGGGKARVLPSLDINLHFTGDLNAVASANNLLAAVVDNHIFRGNELLINPDNVVWRRCLDVSDRGLRNTVIGVGPEAGITRTDMFTISAASEVMAILGLSVDIKDLERRLGDVIVGYSYKNEPITARDLNVQGAMTLLLKDAIKPNLVQTFEGNPAIVHGGPFANIAHGTASIISIQMALRMVDHTIVEAGFGSELGAEKFFNIVARRGGFNVDAGVVVATIRALKRQGGIKNRHLGDENADAVRRGLPNLFKHIENVTLHGVPPVIALNLFEGDSDDEIDVVRTFAGDMNVPFGVCASYENGGEGAVEVSKLISREAESDTRMRFLYDPEDAIEDKITKIASSVYGVDSVVLTKKARRRMESLEALGFSKLPVCMAKTQLSLSSDPKIRGLPRRDAPCTILDMHVSAGAGFIVANSENINLMPGLPSSPIAGDIRIEDDGTVTGVR